MYLATALRDLAGGLEDSELPDTKDVLERAISRFNSKTAAEAIFDAEDYTDESIKRIPPPSGRDADSRHAKGNLSRPKWPGSDV